MVFENRSNLYNHNNYQDYGFFVNRLAHISLITAIRLVNSFNSSRYGRVEVLYNGTWGTICGDYWDLRDADVVCRQLGYEGALSAPRDTTFRYPTSGQRTSQTWLNEVNCEGNEKSISECKHPGWGAHGCRYYFEAGVVCRPSSKAMNT